MKAAPKLFIGEEVLSKLRHICGAISKNEWNAILFYKITKGQMEHPDDLELEVVDLHPMAKGSAASVDFEYDTDWIDVYDDKEHLENCKMGVIHSHVNMGTYHSGTDYNDLETNCDKYDFYLSLVVNNDLDFDAKIAIKAERQVKKKITTTGWIQFKNSLGKLINHPIEQSNDEEETEDLMLVFSVDISIPGIDKSTDEIFNKRVEEIIGNANKPKYSHGQTSMDFYGQSYEENPYQQGFVGNSHIRSSFEDKKKTPTFHSEKSEKIEQGGEMFTDVLSLLSDVMPVVWPQHPVNNVSDAFSDYLEKDIKWAEVNKEAERFVALFLKALEGDAEVDTENEESKKEYVLEILNELVDYLGYFKYTLTQNAIVQELELTLKTYGTK